MRTKRTRRILKPHKLILFISSLLFAGLFIAGTLILSYIFSGHEDTETNDIFGIQQLRASKQPINTLFMVRDNSSSNTDVMLLVNYNPVTAKISVLTIPRDTRIEIEGSSVPKINAAYWAGGPEYAINRVNKLLGVNIQYYVHLNISCIKEIVDLLGGVEFNVPIDMKYSDPTQDLYINLKKGKQILNGEKAEQLLRFRKPQGGNYTKEMLEIYDGSDTKRTEMQMKFLVELIRQKAGFTYLSRLDNILNSIKKNMKTNLALNEITKMSSNLGKIKSNELNIFRIDGEDLNNHGYYFVYNHKIINVNTDESLSGEQIISQFFISKGAYVKASMNEIKNDDEDEDDEDKADNNSNYSPPRETSAPTKTASPLPKATKKPAVKATPSPKKTPEAIPAETPEAIPSETPEILPEEQLNEFPQDEWEEIPIEEQIEEPVEIPLEEQPADPDIIPTEPDTPSVDPSTPVSSSDGSI